MIKNILVILFIFLIICMACDDNYYNSKIINLKPKQIIFKKNKLVKDINSGGIFIMGLGSYSSSGGGEIIIKKYSMFLEDNYGCIKNYTISSDKIIFKYGNMPNISIYIYRCYKYNNFIINGCINIPVDKIQEMHITIPHDSIKIINKMEFGDFNFE